LTMKTELVDYHVHSTFSCDGRSSINDFCRKAIELKFREIGFSEHMDFDPSDEGFGFFNYGSYASAIEEARLLFKNELTIRKGVEVDYQKRFEDQIRDRLKGKNFDFIIGSVHYVKGEIVAPHLLAKRNLKEIYREYFDEIENSVESRLFNVVGHLDVVRKYTTSRAIHQENSEYWKKLEAVLEKIRDSKMFLEINSKPSVFKPRCSEVSPNKKAIKSYLDCGGKRVSVGSDAHSKEELGNGVKETFDFLVRNSQSIDLLFSKERTIRRNDG
jgi:histidinol-phosphatase (PHP family)